MKRRYTNITMAISVAFLTVALNCLHAATKTNMVEDLSGCKLPHGTIEIPEQGSPKALNEGGHILSIAGQKLVPSPWERAGRKPKSMNEYVQMIRNEKAGDLAYSSLNGGTLIAMSGRIRDLGECFLYELGGKDQLRPAMIWGKEERDSSGKGMPGAIEHVDSGSCLVLETVDGKTALIRVLSKHGRNAFIQWVYQPDGSTRFDIPEGDLAPSVGDRLVHGRATEILAASEVSRDGPSVVDVSEQSYGKSLAVHLANRRKVIESAMKMITDDTVAESERVEAIRALGQMRASEAVSLLMSKIDYSDMTTPTRVDTLEGSYPCVGALVRIGKPSSVACIKAFGDRVPEREMGLMCEVMMRVEGADVSELLLKKRLEKAQNDKEKKNIEKALKSIKQARK